MQKREFGEDDCDFGVMIWKRLGQSNAVGIDYLRAHLKLLSNKARPLRLTAKAAPILSILSVASI